MFDISRKNRISLRMLFALGALFGALFFICIYGVRVLDFTNTGWLFYGDNDLRQHYIAWCAFRSDSWSFPIGLIDSLSYPYSMSVIYTDSIPLFAVFFKLFTSVLPTTFQYFGLFGILSFMLMGGFSCVLLARFIDDDIICLIGSGFYISSFQVIHRMYYHTALAAQWIIILALILWVYDSQIKNRNKLILWGFMGFLCVSIHSYFLPMVGMVLAVLMIQQFLSGYRKGATRSEIIGAVKIPLSEFMAFAVIGIIMLYVLGGFYGGTSAYGLGLGTFGSNLNTFVNPMWFGRLMPQLPVFYDFQYEGFGYLGVGVLFLFFTVVVGVIFRRVRKIPEEAFHQSRVPGILSIILVVVSWMAATLPLLSFGDKRIINIPYPHFVERVLGIFRSNGRLIWVAVYVLITAAISFSAYTFRHYRVTAVLLIATALLLQMADESNMYKEKHEYFTKDYEIATLWDDPELDAMAKGKSQFVFLYTDNDITLLSAYYGYLNGIRQNNYYYARDIDEQVNRTIGEYEEELSNGELRDDTVYIVSMDKYMENQSMYESLPVSVMIYKYDHVFFIL